MQKQRGVLFALTDAMRQGKVFPLTHAFCPETLALIAPGQLEAPGAKVFLQL